MVLLLYKKECLFLFWGFTIICLTLPVYELLGFFSNFCITYNAAMNTFM